MQVQPLLVCMQEEAVVMREVDLLCCARHVNIIRLDGAYRSTSGRLYLVFDYVERSLHQDLRASNRKGLSANAVKSFTYQLLQAVGYLHKKQVHLSCTRTHLMLIIMHNCHSDNLHPCSVPGLCKCFERAGLCACMCACNQHASASGSTHQ